MIIFSDASCGDDVIGVGYVIRADDRQYIGSTYYEGEYTSMEAEYIALREAIETARWLHSDEYLNLYTDCDPLVHKLEAANGSDAWNRRRREFLAQMDGREWGLSWVPRERNREANRLAREGLAKGRT